MPTDGSIDAEFLVNVLRTHWQPQDPPGCSNEFVEHPVNSRRALEIGLVHEHRFAFFYWLKWRNDERIVSNDGPVPDLLTVDWHDDVGGTDDFDPSCLAKLNTTNLAELSIFCWCGLRTLNDGHVAPAMHLNAIGDVYVLKKQHRSYRRDEEWQKRIHRDAEGREHHVRYFWNVGDCLESLQSFQTAPLIFDLDLDYFTTYRGEDHPESHRLMKDEEIQSFLNIGNPFMRCVLPRICGITLALEPEYCGGIHNSFHVLNLLSSEWFSSPLHSKRCRWRKRRRSRS